MMPLSKISPPDPHFVARRDEAGFCNIYTYETYEEYVRFKLLDFAAERGRFETNLLAV
jgi:hypothetical protein